MGERANICTANSTRANTDKSESSRDARTTLADMAAFIESTEVRLRNGHFIAFVLFHEEVIPFTIFMGARRGIIRQ
jgi:hypothetical protein